MNFRIKMYVLVKHYFEEKRTTKVLLIVAV
jgi:hypothetical protein